MHAAGARRRVRPWARRHAAVARHACAAARSNSDRTVGGIAYAAFSVYYTLWTMSAAVVIDSKMEPPAWAKLQRELLEKQTEACVEFFGASHVRAFVVHGVFWLYTCGE
jgi:hypothetical protein